MIGLIDRCQSGAGKQQLGAEVCRLAERRCSAGHRWNQPFSHPLQGSLGMTPPISALMEDKPGQTGQSNGKPAAIPNSPPNCKPVFCASLKGMGWRSDNLHPAL